MMPNDGALWPSPRVLPPFLFPVSPCAEWFIFPIQIRLQILFDFLFFFLVHNPGVKGKHKAQFVGSDVKANYGLCDQKSVTDSKYAREGERKWER